MTLEEELGEQYRQKGLDRALTHYQELKTKYLATGAYDFSERSLNLFAYEVLEKKDTAGAIRVFTLNTQLFPTSANVWDSLAEGYMKAGDRKALLRKISQARSNQRKRQRNAKED